MKKCFLTEAVSPNTHGQNQSCSRCVGIGAPYRSRTAGPASLDEGISHLRRLRRGITPSSIRRSITGTYPHIRRALEVMHLHRGKLRGADNLFMEENPCGAVSVSSENLCGAVVSFLRNLCGAAVASVSSKTSAVRLLLLCEAKWTRRQG